MPTPKCPFSPADARPVCTLWICANFLRAINDPAFPFAADAELVIPCERDLFPYATAGFRISCATQSIFPR